MNAIVYKSDIKGSVKIPPSKSFAHRLLIAASLSKNNTTVKNVGTSDDVKVTINSLNSLGAKIMINDNDAIVCPIKKVNSNPIMNVGESGSTLRFMIPLVKALGVNATFKTKGRLSERPNDELLRVLDEHTSNGKLQNGVYEIDASISSQYITGLMLSLPLLDGDSQIVFKNELVSKGYLDITEEVLKQAKIKFAKLDNGYKIFGNQLYNIDNSVVEGDFSSAAFMFVLSSFSNDIIEIKELNNNSVQGDRVIVDILQNSGVKISFEDGSYFVKKNDKLKTLDLNLENSPDLCPILAVFASFVKGKSRIGGVERLRIKESDRITAILDMLTCAGIEATYNDKELIIEGGCPKSGKFNGYKDHRIVMSSVILSLLATTSQKSIVSDAECVSKSYPSFFEDVIKLGGKVSCQNG